MGFFSKKKTDEKGAGQTGKKTAGPKNELGTEIEKLEKTLGEKQAQLDEVTQKIASIKEEYNSAVGSLMVVKKELNQKKMELDIIQREYREIRERKKRSELIKDRKSVEEFSKTEGEYSKIKEELEEFKRKYKEIKEQVTRENATLHNIKKQQIDVGKELEEANSRLYNAKEALDKKDTFEDTSILTPSEKKFIGADKENQKSSAAVIEAASAVVGSLKSKLGTTQKELETVQTLLKNERDEHEKTKRDLEDLRRATQSLTES